MAQRIYQHQKQAGQPVSIDKARELANQTAQRVNRKQKGK